MYSNLPFPMNQIIPAQSAPQYAPQWQGNPNHAQMLPNIVNAVAGVIHQKQQANPLRVFAYNLYSQNNWNNAEFNDLVLFCMDLYAFNIDTGRMQDMNQALQAAAEFGTNYIVAQLPNQFQAVYQQLQQMGAMDILQSTAGLQQEFQGVQSALRAYKQQIFSQMGQPQQQQMPMGNSFTGFGNSVGGVDPRMQQMSANAGWNPRQGVVGGNRFTTGVTTNTNSRQNAPMSSGRFVRTSTPEAKAVQITTTDQAFIGNRASSPPVTSPPISKTVASTTPEPVRNAAMSETNQDDQMQFTRSYFNDPKTIDDFAERMIRGRWKRAIASGTLPADAPDPTTPPDAFYRGTDPDEVIWPEVKQQPVVNNAVVTAAAETSAKPTLPTKDEPVMGSTTEHDIAAPEGQVLGKASTPEQEAPPAQASDGTKDYRIVDVAAATTRQHEPTTASNWFRSDEGPDLDWDLLGNAPPSRYGEGEPLSEVQSAVAADIVAEASVREVIAKPVFVPNSEVVKFNEIIVGADQTIGIGFHADQPYQFLHHPSKQVRLLLEEIDTAAVHEEVRDRNKDDIPNMNYDEHVINTRAGRRLRLGLEDAQSIEEAQEKLRQSSEEYWEKQKLLREQAGEAVFPESKAGVELYPMGVFEGAESSIWMMLRVKHAQLEEKTKNNVFVGFGYVNEPAFCRDGDTVKFYETVFSCESYSALYALMKLYLSDVDKGVWEIVNKRATASLNHTFVNVLSFDYTAQINDFFAEFENAEAALRQMDAKVVRAYDRIQARQLKRFFYRPDDKDARSYTGSVCHFLEEDSVYNDQMKYFGGFASYTYIDVKAADLDLGIHQGKPYLITDMYTPVMSRLLKTIFHATDTGKESDDIRHFIRTADGVDFEVSEGALMEDAWLISLRMN